MTSCRSFFTSTILCFPLFHLSLLNYRVFSPLLFLTYSIAIAIAAIPQDIGQESATLSGEGFCTISANNATIRNPQKLTTVTIIGKNAFPNPLKLLLKHSSTVQKKQNGKVTFMISNVCAATAVSFVNAFRITGIAIISSIQAINVAKEPPRILNLLPFLIRFQFPAP